MVRIGKMLGLGEMDMVGLDIGTSSVKMVQLRKDKNGYTAISAAIAGIDRKTGNAQHIQTNTVNAINECFKNSGTQTRNAVCGLSGHDVMVRAFNFPPMPPEVIEQALLLEARQVCPFDINKSVLDYQMLTPVNVSSDQNSPQSIRGIFVVAANDAVQNKIGMLGEASVKTILMDVDGLALLNCVSEYEPLQQGMGVAVIDIGSDLTKVVILGSDGLPFIRNLPYAGDSILRQISNDVNIPVETIEKILHAEIDSKDQKQTIIMTLKKASARLITDISETLRFYSMQQNSSVIDKIYVCGGMAIADEFITMLNENLSKQVLVLNPFKKIKCDTDTRTTEMLQKYGALMAVAAGLAMRSI